MGKWFLARVSITSGSRGYADASGPSGRLRSTYSKGLSRPGRARLSEEIEEEHQVFGGGEGVIEPGRHVVDGPRLALVFRLT
jgi:hypothetical protein